MATDFASIKSNDSSLPEQVAERISQLIRDQHLNAGDKIPNEFELASQLNVGRGSIREAVKLLVSRNVLSIHRGVGTFVASHPGQIDDPLGFAFYPDQVHLAMDLLEVRTSLEPWVAETAAQRATEENIQEVRKACAVVEEDVLAVRNHLPNDVKFHVAVARCTQNAVVPNLIPIISYSVGLFGTLTENALKAETVICHRAIADAIAARDPETARRMMQQHLEQNRVALEQVIRNLNGNPGEAAHS